MVTLSMMMSGTHSLAASPGLSTTYPRLDWKVQPEAREDFLAEKRDTLSYWEKGNVRIGLPVQTFWLQPHTIILRRNLLSTRRSWGGREEKPSKGKTRLSPVQSSSQLPSHTGCSWESVSCVSIVSWFFMQFKWPEVDLGSDIEGKCLGLVWDDGLVVVLRQLEHLE